MNKLFQNIFTYVDELNKPQRLLNKLENDLRTIKTYNKVPDIIIMSVDDLLLIKKVIHVDSSYDLNSQGTKFELWGLPIVLNNNTSLPSITFK